MDGWISLHVQMKFGGLIYLRKDKLDKMEQDVRLCQIPNTVYIQGDTRALLLEI